MHSDHNKKFKGLYDCCISYVHHCNMNFIYSQNLPNNFLTNLTNNFLINLTKWKDVVEYTIPGESCLVMLDILNHCALTKPFDLVIKLTFSEQKKYACSNAVYRLQ